MLVSVIIPVYNCENAIERCLQSVLKDTVESTEILVINDGSTDGTAAVLQRMAAADERIRVFDQENAGVSAARNRGLAECRGRYIRFVDADDRVPPGALQVLIAKMEADESDLVIAGFDCVKGQRRKRRNLKKTEETMDVTKALRHMSHWGQTYFYGALWNKLFLGDVIRRHRLQFVNGVALGEDFIFVCHYMTHARTVSYSQASVYEYERTFAGLTMQQFRDCFRHPLKNAGLKLRMYREMKNLFVQKGVYRQYRHCLWLYMLRVTISN